MKESGKNGFQASTKYKLKGSFIQFSGVTRIKKKLWRCIERSEIIKKEKWTYKIPVNLRNIQKINPIMLPLITMELWLK